MTNFGQSSATALVAWFVFCFMQWNSSSTPFKNDAWWGNLSFTKSYVSEQSMSKAFMYLVFLMNLVWAFSSFLYFERDIVSIGSDSITYNNNLNHPWIYDYVFVLNFLNVIFYKLWVMVMYGDASLGEAWFAAIGSTIVALSMTLTMVFMFVDAGDFANHEDTDDDNQIWWASIMYLVLTVWTWIVTAFTWDVHATLNMLSEHEGRNRGDIRSSHLGDKDAGEHLKEVRGTRSKRTGFGRIRRK